MTWQPTYMEYRVIEIKDSLFRGKQSSAALENVLNQQAQQGWKFKSMMASDIKAPTRYRFDGRCPDHV